MDGSKFECHKYNGEKIQLHVGKKKSSVSLLPLSIFLCMRPTFLFWLFPCFLCLSLSLSIFLFFVFYHFYSIFVFLYHYCWRFLTIQISIVSTPQTSNCSEKNENALPMKKRNTVATFAAKEKKIAASFVMFLLLVIPRKKISSEVKHNIMW